MQIANITKGIVQRAAGTPRQSTFNSDMVVSISIKNFDGTTLNIWGKAGSEIENYKIGDAIEYCKSGKEYVFFNAPKANAPHAQSDNGTTKQNADYNTNVGNSLKWQQPTKDIKQSMLEYTAFQSKVYQHIFKSVCDDFQDYGLKDAELKDISTTIFIQTQRKFNF
jgi:hypothetical protein